MFGKGYKVELEEGKASRSDKKIPGSKNNDPSRSIENYAGKKYKLSNIIQRQARSIATFVRGEGIQAAWGMVGANAGNLRYSR